MGNSLITPNSQVPQATLAATIAERLAAENGIAIEPLRKKNVRKGERVHAVLAKRGQHPGLVAIFSAMEHCPTYQPWHHKETGKTYLRPDDGKCLHYYFYFRLESPPPTAQLKIK